MRVEMDNQQLCGNCKFFKNIGICEAPIPAAITVYDRENMTAMHGADCPCWAPRSIISRTSDALSSACIGEPMQVKTIDIPISKQTSALIDAEFAALIDHDLVSLRKLTDDFLVNSEHYSSGAWIR